METKKFLQEKKKNTPISGPAQFKPVFSGSSVYLFIYVDIDDTDTHTHTHNCHYISYTVYINVTIYIQNLLYILKFSTAKKFLR